MDTTSNITPTDSMIVEIVDMVQQPLVDIMALSTTIIAAIVHMMKPTGESCDAKWLSFFYVAKMCAISTVLINRYIF